MFIIVQRIKWIEKMFHTRIIFRINFFADHQTLWASKQNDELILLFAQKTFWLARLKLGKYILFFEWGSRLMFRADHSLVNTFYKFSCKTEHLSRIRIVRPASQNIFHNLECVWVVLLSSAVENLWPIQEIKSENKIVVFAKHQSIFKVRNVQNYWHCHKFLTFQINFNIHGWQVYWNVSWKHVHMCNSYLSKPIIFVSVYI